MSRTMGDGAPCPCGLAACSGRYCSHAHQGVHVFVRGTSVTVRVVGDAPRFCSGCGCEATPTHRCDASDDAVATFCELADDVADAIAAFAAAQRNPARAAQVSELGDAIDDAFALLAQLAESTDTTAADALREEPASTAAPAPRG